MNPLALLAMPALPAASALFLALFGARLRYNALGVAAAAAPGAAFALALGFLPLGILGGGSAATLDLGSWISTRAFQADLRLRLDSAGLCMVLLVTFFGTLITAYSIGYMRDDREQPRFFAGLNLFVAAMLALVLSDNLALIFLGWEGVGLCSYLLIGHYWDRPGVPAAAFRAFFVNRIGDLLFLLGVFTVFSAFGTVSLSELQAQGAGHLAGREKTAAWAALLLLGGVFAKSAQAPLHVWLADAMAGPTPVSALIHAATMVTAGVYLVMRLDWLYAAVPEARFVVGICAFVTLAVGALLALAQTDVKKILAYSTLSNLALMFLALAAGSSGAAMLHLFGHAFFKALLFLAAGSVILAAHHEQDVRRLKGTLRSLPVTRAAFWIGCLGGAGLIPWLSAGFFTKEAVLESLRASSLDGFGLHVPGGLLYGATLAVESLSALYLFRLLGYLSGDDREAAYAGEDGPLQGGHGEKNRSMRLVLALLAAAAPAFAFFSGRPALLRWVTGGNGEADALHWGPVLPALAANWILAAVCFLAFSSARRRQALSGVLGRFKLPAAGPLARRFYFDDAYNVLILLPVKVLAWACRLTLENLFITAPVFAGWAGQGVSLMLRRLQTGRVQQYAAWMLLAAAAGACFLLWN